ncbi:hypothetical protein DFH07DRAFT_767940 [Mycena maculata]|uniref:Uncharacterized protein n=1 Tax=Mycena maculata TaxID=230809 RepID=A0AAD7NRJ3_9AGAR|nr:hypothetical protein DFH07DRAFT_767940 [Mycena maculata]
MYGMTAKNNVLTPTPAASLTANSDLRCSTTPSGNQRGHGWVLMGEKANGKDNEEDRERVPLEILLLMRRTCNTDRGVETIRGALDLGRRARGPEALEGRRFQKTRGPGNGLEWYKEGSQHHRGSRDNKREDGKADKRETLSNPSLRKNPMILDGPEALVGAYRKYRKVDVRAGYAA